MYTAVRILGFLSLFLTIQGFKDREEGLKFLGDLENQVNDHVSGVELLIQDGKRKLGEEHDLLRRKANARSGQVTEDIIKEADRRQCPQELKNKIANVHYTFSDRWTECMNLTSKLVSFEKVASELWDDYLAWRPKVCATANTMMLCFDKNIFSEMTCVYDSVKSSMDQFKQMSNELVKIVDEVHQIVQNTIEDFKGCFGSIETNIREKQEELLELGCPKFRFGRFRR